MSDLYLTIVMIPGIWVRPKIYDEVSFKLQAQGYLDTTIALPITSRPSPGNPTIHDDEAFIRRGFLGTSAVQNLSRKARAERGLKGRVLGFVFLSAALVEVGYSHKELPLPFFDVNNETGEMHCVDLKHTLFNDIDEEKTAKWMKELRCQPARGWGLTTEYAGFEEALSVYLVCENDQAVPLV